MSTGTMRDDSKGLTAAIANVKDKAGNPTTVDTPPVWSSSNTAIATVEAAADGMSAQVLPAGIGECDINIVITNADGSQATGSGHVAVTAGEAASFDVGFTLNA